MGANARRKGMSGVAQMVFVQRALKPVEHFLAASP
jgi:hypothetical protein